MPVLPSVGDQFGRYRIDSLVGRGGMGVVFGATDTSLRRRVALKVVSGSLGGSTEFVRRFEREAAVLARLDSPHVIAIYDVGSHADCPYIATQFVGGGDLGAHLAARGPLRPDLALRLCAQVADALHDAHRVGVVHRDVKPTNVLLRDPDADELHAYLCDFGIARTATDGLTAPGAVAGTWSYLSPECGRGAPGSPSSDVYALGCLLWATLTGLPPYRGTDVEIAVAHQRSAVRQLPGSSPAIAAANAVLARAMAKDPAERYQDADRLRLALLDAARRPGADAPLPPVPAGDPRTLPLAPPAPTPTPLPGGGATPAGASRPPSLPGAQPAPYAAASAAPHRSPSRRRHAVLAAVAAVVAIAVGGVAAAVYLGTQDDPARAGGSDPTASGTSGTSGSTGAPGPGARVDEGGPITGDRDGDGLGDLGVVFDSRDPQGTLLTTWRSDGSAFVDAATAELAPLADGDGTWQLQGHLDDDGVADVLTFAQPDDEGPVRVTGELSGGTTIDTDLPGGDRPRAYDALADVDGDGLDDLVTLQVLGTDPERLAYSTWAFDGETFAAPVEQDSLPSFDSTWLEPGDFDGDGHVDRARVVVSDRYDGTTGQYDATLEVRLGDDTGALGPPTTLALDLFNDLDVVAGDVDGDERDEIVLVERDFGFLQIGRVDLDDDALTLSPTVGSIRDNGTTYLEPDVALLDVTGDGRDDVVVASQVRRGGTGRVLVGVAGDRSFVSRRWLAWKQTFAVRDGEGRLEILEDSRW